MYIVSFDICAICVLIILLFTLRVKNNIPISQNRLFTLLAALVLVSTACDLISGVWDNSGLSAGPAMRLVLEISSYLYFLARNTTPFLYVLYIITVLNLEWKSRVQLGLLLLPLSVAYLLIGLTPFFQLVFHLEKSGAYHRGPALPFLYCIAAYYLGLGVYLIIRYRNFIPFARRLAFHSFVSLALGTVCIQALFPYVLVEGFGTTLCVLLIYLTIQRPEEVLDGPSGLLNKSAFHTILSLKFQQKARFQVFTIVITQVQSLEKSLSLNMMYGLTSAIGSWLRQNVKRATLFRISEGHLCVIPKRFNPEYMEQLSASIMERFSHPWDMNGLRISLPSYFMLINCPEDAVTPGQVVDMLEMIPEEAIRPCPALLQPNELNLADRQRRRAIRQIVSQALEQRLLEVYYQPIYSAKTGRFTSAEALLRLRHPQLGFIPPDEFIPIAEETGAIVPIGQFVLESVCRCLSENRLHALGIEYIEVNLSVVECFRDDLPETIQQTLDKYGVLPGQINLEITETAMSTMSDTVLCNLNKLSGAGIRFSLDDYGTGYSNLTRLMGMPLDIIKIDKSLIQSLFSSRLPGADIVLGSTFQMLRRLNKKVLAEGIETEEQARQLINMGCEFIQGYYYARPMPVKAFLALLSEKNVLQPGAG